ncbi:hypothetical protein ERHA54_50140 (plasmid) [Erwinia rhapontici]|nr:hypothetical protein ERHA54_50140 [Erwinia rhapontici]
MLITAVGGKMLGVIRALSGLPKRFLSVKRHKDESLC